MHKIFTCLLLLALPFTKGFAQCAEVQQPRVLLMGDSWAYFLNFEQTINLVLTQYGHSNYTYVTSGIISENGAETDDFFKPEKQAEIINLLNQNPTIDLVHLSIGGNDMLGDWKKSFTQAQTDTLMNQVLGRLDSIVRFLKAAKPGIRIVWSGYTYPNFEEVIESAAPFQTSHPFYGTWSDMEFPNFLEINTVLNQVCAAMQVYADNDPQVDFVNAVGILQYTFGQTTALGVPPGGTYPAFSVPLPMGNPNYPSPKNSMRDYLLTKDCYHLSPKGYKDFIGYQAQKFYQKYLMDDLYLLADSTQTGTVSAQGSVAATLAVGEAAGDQLATVLSFNTTGMADTTLEKASIFLRRKSLTGTNPVGNTLEVKVKSGNFGTTVNIEAADFNAAGDASGNPCQFGSKANDNDWVRLDLPYSVLQQINHNAATQFIISAPGFTGGKMDFYGSSDPEYSPILNMKYGIYNSLNEIEAQNIAVYPNPAQGLLTIKNNTGNAITHVEVVDLAGRTVLAPAFNGNTVDVSPLAKGMYILNITTRAGKATSKIFKD